MVIVLAGRRIDPEGASPSRFPLSAVATVSRRLLDFFKRAEAQWLVCSGASGADLLALEAAGELGIRRRMILPAGQRLFRERSVTDRPGNWGERFDRIYASLSASGDVRELDLAEGEAGYREVNHRLLEEGLALSAGPEESAAPTAKLSSALTARPSAVPAAKSSLLVLLVWDGYPKGETDMTFELGQEAARHGIPVHTIPIASNQSYP